MNLFAFFAVRGWKLSELAALSETEKLFLHRAKENYYDEMNLMLGGRG